ncbi:MAG: hypothetical protein PWQ89_760 [Verrucomicrobiota bacterium]|nr:hypothetical protein [Verrucomicrobiota bacterium]
MFGNLALADERNRPGCQDTGIIRYFAQVGSRPANGLNEIGIAPGRITGNRSIMGVQIEQAGRTRQRLPWGSPPDAGLTEEHLLKSMPRWD